MTFNISDYLSWDKIQTTVSGWLSQIGITASSTVVKLLVVFVGLLLVYISALITQKVLKVILLIVGVLIVLLLVMGA